MHNVFPIDSSGLPILEAEIPNINKYIIFKIYIIVETTSKKSDDNDND